MNRPRLFRWLHWVLVGVGMAITALFTICEATGNSLGQYVPLEPVTWASELAGWLFFLGDDANSRAELYI